MAIARQLVFRQLPGTCLGLQGGTQAQDLGIEPQGGGILRLMMPWACLVIAAAPASMTFIITNSASVNMRLAAG